jgi:hypothetical protein
MTLPEPSLPGPSPVPGGDEITAVFRTQLDAGHEILEHVASARSVDILALRGTELVSLVAPLVEAARAARPDRVVVRVLLLDPDAEAARSRATQLGEPQESFVDEIRRTQEQMTHLATHTPGLSLQLLCYAELPIWRMVVVDDVLYVSILCPPDPDRPAAVYRLRRVPEGSLHPGFLAGFDAVLAGARPLLATGG